MSSCMYYKEQGKCIHSIRVGEKVICEARRTGVLPEKVKMKGFYTTCDCKGCQYYHFYWGTFLKQHGTLIYVVSSVIGAIIGPIIGLCILR